jgi:hypothetical protein
VVYGRDATKLNMCSVAGRYIHGPETPETCLGCSAAEHKQVPTTWCLETMCTNSPKSASSGAVMCALQHCSYGCKVCHYR